MALNLRERSHELGVRRALGASARRLRSDVPTETLGVTIASTAAGLAVALLLSPLRVPRLLEVAPWDPGTVLGVCGVLLGVALLAVYLPARIGNCGGSVGGPAGGLTSNRQLPDRLIPVPIPIPERASPVGLALPVVLVLSHFLYLLG